MKQLESELQESRSEVSLLQVALRRKEEQHQQQTDLERSTPLSLPTTLPTADSLTGFPSPPLSPQPLTSTLGSPKTWTSFVLERSGTVDLDLTSKSIVNVTKSLDDEEWEKSRPSREQERYDEGVMKGVRGDVEKLGETIVREKQKILYERSRHFKKNNGLF